MAYIGQAPANKPLGASDITDGIISNSKLAQDIISAETELATAPADTDEFLISDAGTLKRIDASLVVGGGKVLQVVSASDSTTYSGNPGQSFIEPLSSLRAVITPSATSSKIFVLLTLPMAGGDSGNVASGQLTFDTSGGSSDVIVPPNSSQQVDSEYAHFPLPLLETTYDQHSVAYSVLHSANTTSALTYKFRCKSENTGSATYINRTIRNNTLYDPTSVATITAIEIGT